jgi:hypothetical protein
MKTRRSYPIVWMILALDGLAFGQPLPQQPVPPVAVPAPTANLPEDFVAAGVGWNQYAIPQINGWASYARRISSGMYSFTTYDVTSIRTRPFTAQTSTRTGIAMWLRSIGPVQIFGLGDAGAAISGSNIGGAFSGGGVIGIPLGGSGFRLVLGARVLKTSLSEMQTIYEAGFGWGH